MSTLRYAARAKTIKKSVTKNEESGQIDKLNEEVARLKKMLAEKAAEAASGGGDSGGGPVNDEELKAAQSMLSTQITEMEALTRQTWQDKQQASRQHEAEVAKMRRAHKDAARRAEAERRKRFQLLRQKGDVELSVKELALPSKWADAARALDALKGRVGERRSHVAVFRDALGEDLRLLREAGPRASCGPRSRRPRPRRRRRGAARARRRAPSATRRGCLGAKGGPGGVGWRPDAGDDEAWLGFEFDKPTKCREVVLQSGLIAATSDHARSAEGPVVVDGAAPRKTVAALGEIISWSALKFKSLDKVEKLLNRPPVRFLQDVRWRRTPASPPGWLGEGRSLPVPSKDPDAKKAYFDSVLQTLKSLDCAKDLLLDGEANQLAFRAGPVASSESILSGQGVDGTNAMLQLVAAAAKKASPREAPAAGAKPRVTSKPTAVSLERSENGAWIPVGDKPLPVDASTGRAAAPDAPAAAAWRLRVAAWAWDGAEAPPGSRAGLVGARREPEASTRAATPSGRAVCAAASAALEREASLLTGAMRAAAGRRGGGEARRVGDGARARAPTRARKYGEVKAEVETLRAAAARHNAALEAASAAEATCRAAAEDAAQRAAAGSAAGGEGRAVALAKSDAAEGRG
ncbi:hypothetical protein JL721_1897 [Aureococcus anophagefferens]|nr:hypothetical protein JL721_1897 [Aureococcus anophagefferens]